MKTTFKSQLRNIMTTAWMLVKKYGLTIAEAMKQSWLIAKLKGAMHHRVVEFFFKKTDNTIRQAFGTLMESRVPQTAGARKTADTCVTYWDVEKEAWRCFKKVNLIKMA